MTAAVGASTTTTSSGYGAAGQTGALRGSRAGLEAQLNTYKKQLADWVDCPSGKTPEGKKKIESLDDKVSTTQARIKELDKTLSKSASGSNLNADTKADSQRIGDNPISSVSDVKTVQATTRANSAGAGPGGVIDTFA
jgi:hypothetical protein